MNHRTLVVLAALALACAFGAPGLAAPEDPARGPAASPSPSPTASASPAPPLRWRSLGPTVGGGRVTSVTGSDRDANLFYVGTAGGGVWRSRNGGLDWSQVFDETAPASIGAVALDPRDDREVWVGTGEGWPRNDVIAGAGIYHSSDGAKTWKRAGLEGTSQIARIAIDPKDSHRIFVAALGSPFRESDERGVYRTTDGGATWQRVLAVDASTGASDLALDPHDPSTVYAGMWTYHRSSWHLTSGGPRDGLFVSHDGGTTWNRLSGHGLPEGILGRIALAVAPSNPKRVYAMIESSHGLLWRSDDAGATWALVSSNTLINERPFYYSRITVDPHDADHLFSVSVKLAESRDGGRAWHPSGKRLHGDHHDVWISADGKTVIDGNDGGPGISRDGGSTWDWNKTLSTAQIYHVGFGPGYPYAVCGGLQDNGSWCGPVATGDGRGILQRDWTRVSGGDGTWVVPDPRDPNFVWSSSGGGDNGGEIILTDLRTGNQTDISPYLRDQNVVPPAELRYRFNWETPIAFSPDGRTAYTAGNVVFRSIDRGAHWSPISPDLTRNLRERQSLSGTPLTLDVTGAETYDTILDVEPSPRDGAVLWVTTDDGKVQLTRDGGAHWRDVTPPGLDADARIPAVEPSRAVTGRAYVAVDRHFAGDDAPYAYVTDDWGAHWRPIAGGIAAHAFVRAVREDPREPRILYAATERGVWWSEDRGGAWSPFPAPFPPVSVHDLRVHPGNDLLAATHGRGLLVFDDLRPLQDRMRTANATALVFEPRARRVLRRSTPTTEVRGAADDAPAIGLTFWQRTAAARPPEIQLVDARGTVVRRIGGPGDLDDDGALRVTNLAGYNRVTLDGTEDAPTPWRRAPKWDRGPDQGPLLLSGTYTVRLQRDGTTFTAPLVIGRNTALAPTAADELAGHTFATNLARAIGRVDDILNAIDNLRLQLPQRLASLRSADPNAATSADAVLRDANALRASLSSDQQNSQDNDFLRDMLRERLISIYGNAAFATPPGGMQAEAAALFAEEAQATAQWRALARRIDGIQTALRAAHLAALDLAARPAPEKPDPNADERAPRRGSEE